MHRFVLLVVGALAFPTSATGNRRARFSSLLLSIRSGAATRVQLLVLPIYRSVEKSLPLRMSDRSRW